MHYSRERLQWFLLEYFQKLIHGSLAILPGIIPPLLSRIHPEILPRIFQGMLRGITPRYQPCNVDIIPDSATKNSDARRYSLARCCLSVASRVARAPLGFASIRGGYYHYYYFDEFTIHTQGCLPTLGPATQKRRRVWTLGLGVWEGLAYLHNSNANKPTAEER